MLARVRVCVCMPLSVSVCLHVMLGQQTWTHFHARDEALA